MVHSEGRGDELGDCVGKVALDVDFVLPSGALRNGSAARELLTQFLGRVFEINKKVSVGRDVRISYSANSAYVMYAVYLVSALRTLQRLFRFSLRRKINLREGRQKRHVENRGFRERERGNRNEAGRDLSIAVTRLVVRMRSIRSITPCLPFR